MYTIEWIAAENLSIILPLLKSINETTEENVLAQRLEEMCNQNYKCAGVFDKGKLIGICGVWVLHKHYVGKHIELDNVVLLPEYRNRRIGENLITWIEAWAKGQGCTCGELNCYVYNSAGIKFWMNQGYKIIGFHCQKKW